MKRLFHPRLVLLINSILPFHGQSQNVGIGTNAPTQKLEVNGAIGLGGTTNNTEGAIRWNAVKNDFEGYNGIAWVSLTGGKGKWGDQTKCCFTNDINQLRLVPSRTLM